MSGKRRFTKVANIISVLGLGNVGLPAALLLAQAGKKVIGVDLDNGVVNPLRKGILPSHIQEKKLKQLIKNPKVRKNLTIRTTPSLADVFIIAVPTPLHKSKRMADLSFVKKAILSILPFLKKGNLVVIESTIPPMTCRSYITPLIERSGLKVGKTIFLAYCPERVLPGDIYQEIIHNDRIIGGVNKKSRELATNLYSSFVKGHLYETDDVTAELCKLMENAYRDVNIALANEFANVAENLGVNSKEVINLANKHPRVNILNPGIGVGGHCIPVDPWFIYQVDSKNTRLVFTAREINDKVPVKIAEKIKKMVSKIKDPKIVAIGASYKPNAADTRESPAIEIVRLLRKEGYDVAHYDPLVSGYECPKSLANACSNADLLVILVAHKIVLDKLRANREKIRAVLRNPRIIVF